MQQLIDRLNSLDARLESNILGQPEVLSQVSALLKRSMCGLRFPERPIASMLFLGPTGVGKTETALLFTDHLFADKGKLVRIDLSEYMVADSIGILRGKSTSERGILGQYYDRSGGFGTLLFDEIEKAHPLILDVFLQILSAGRFTLANGETLDLSNYLVVATSNVGARMLMESRSTDRETLVRRTTQAGVSDFRPETFARFDLHAVFNKLDYMTLKRIGKLHVDRVLQIINEQGHSISCDQSLIDHVHREGYSEKFGARPIQNAAMRVIGNVVASEMLKNRGSLVNGVISHDPRTDKFAIKPICPDQNAAPTESPAL